MTRKQTRSQRTDKGTWKRTARDTAGMRLVAEQKVVRMDTLGEYFAKGFAPAQEILPLETSTKDTTNQQEQASNRSNGQHPKRGGSRKETPWPPDLRHRLMAVRRIVRKWVERGHAEIWQPWAGQPGWVKLTQAGLQELGLDVDAREEPFWTELEWPDKNKLRDDIGSKGPSIDGTEKLSHYHRLNQVRMALARGNVNDVPPQHTWHSEREVEILLPRKVKGTRLPHKVDGYVELGVDWHWDIPRREGAPESLAFPKGSRIAIEVELTRKRFEAYERFILPDLLRYYDAALYFCSNDAYQAVLNARRDRLETNEQRKRIRIIRLQKEPPRKEIPE